MVTRTWHRNHTTFLDDGTTPLVQAAGTEVILTGGESILRTRTTLEIYVAAVSSTGNLVNFAGMNNVEIAMGIIGYDHATPPSTTPTPLTDPANPSGSLGWLIYEYMYPTVNFFKESDVETATWTWRTDPITLDVQTRRKTTPGNQPSVHLAWELIDTSGLLNNTVSGTTYALGARYSIQVLGETFP